MATARTVQMIPAVTPYTPGAAPAPADATQASFFGTPLSAIVDKITGAAAAQSAYQAKQDAAAGPAVPSTVGGLIGAIPSALTAVTNPVASAANYLGSLFSGPGPSSTDAIKATPATPVDPVANALTQGRAAAVAAAAAAPTPQDQLGTALTAILGGHPTVGVLQALGGLPAISQLATASTKPVQSAKDKAFGADLATTLDLYNNEVAASAQKYGVNSQQHADNYAKATDKVRRNLNEIVSPRGAQVDALSAPAE